MGSKMLEEYFEDYKNTPSDINQHFDVLRRYAEETDTIVDIGVRGIVSTWALLAGLPKEMLSLDIQDPKKFGGDINEVYRVAKEEGVKYEFKIADSLTCNIPECDLMFLDTAHDFAQLKAELFRHHTKVKKYIILHDTATYAFKDEGVYNNIPEEQNVMGHLEGLIPAIENFTRAGFTGWYIHERFAHNNGLTILRKR